MLAFWLFANVIPGTEYANDTTIWSNNGTEYERALDGTFSKVADFKEVKEGRG